MQFDKNRGYWQVDGEYYTNKVRAIIAAQHRGLDHDAISYHYNDPWWDEVDWADEPTQSLDDLYLSRAQQLRDKYKTLILRFSGGADSTNIIRTFVENKIKIDIVALNTWMHPSQTDPWLSTQNIEKKLVTLPFVEKLKAEGTEFKIIVNDYSPTIDVLGDDPGWIFDIDSPRFMLTDICAPRACTTEEFSAYDDETTAIIVGIDKPKVVCKQNKIWYWTQADLWHSLINQTNKMITEPFYWTADMPAIPIKQSHVVKKFFQNNRAMMLSTQTQDEFRAGNKSHLVPLIYPKYYGHLDPTQNDLSYWDHDKILLAYKNQKACAPRGCGIDWEFHKHPKFGIWKKGIDLADRLIDRRFKNENSIWNDGLKQILSKPRWLGK